MPERHYHVEKFERHKLLFIYQLSFLLFSGSALFSCFQSPFVNQYTTVENLGWFFVIGNLISLFMYQLLPYFIERLGKYKSTIFILFIYFCLMGLLAMLARSWLVLMIFVLYIAVTPLLEVIFDLLIESFSVDKFTGRIRSFYNTLIDAGWVLAAALGGFLLANYSFKTMFAFIFLAIFAVFILFVWRFKPEDFSLDFHEYFRLQILWQALSNNKINRSIFFIYFIISFFFSWMVIYIPLYLSPLGLSMIQIGEILSVTYLSYVIFDYPIGWIVDKKIKEEYIIALGVLVISITTLAIIFITSTQLGIWMIVLFLGRLGCSMVYNANESYFFKSIDQRDIDLVTAYRGMGILARVVAPLIAVLILQHVDLVLLFPILGIIMLSGIWFFLQIKKKLIFFLKITL